MKFTAIARFWCFAALSCFCGNAVFAASSLSSFEFAQDETVIAEVERSIAALEAGRPLSPKQRELLFPETASHGVPFFRELNFRDRRIRKLRELILASPQFSESTKSIFLEMTSESAYRAALESIFLEPDEALVVLPRSEWADEFRKSGPPEAEQKKLLDAYAAQSQRYELALESFFSGGDISPVIEERQAVDRAWAKVAALSPPEDAAAEKRLCEYFFNEIFSVEMRIKRRKMELFEKDRHRALFLFERENALPEIRHIPYLREYQILRLVAERKRQKESGNAE